MQFGVMTQIQMPRPWGENAELRAYNNAIAQAEAADAGGFSHYWITEQHFFLEIGHSACPDMLLAAMNTPEMKTKFEQGGLFPDGTCGAKFGTFLNNITADYEKITTAAGIKPN